MPIYSIIYYPYGDPNDELSRGNGIVDVETIIIDAPNEQTALQKFVELSIDGNNRTLLNIRKFLIDLVMDENYTPSLFYPLEHRELLYDMGQQFFDAELDSAALISHEIGDYISQNMDNFIFLLQMLVKQIPAWIRIRPVELFSAYPTTKSAR